MSIRRKIAVSGIFLLGSLSVLRMSPRVQSANKCSATAASIARMAVYLKAVYGM